MMKWIVGLGNPGPKYAFTRHNIGFMVLDALSDSKWKTAHQSLISKIKIENNNVLLLKPQTYMNLSGRAVKEALSSYKISIQDLLVIHDDMDQSFLSMKFQKNRGAGGHNGVIHLNECLGSNDYHRLKLGVGRPERGSVSSYVLSPFSKDQMNNLEDFISKAVEAIQCFVIEGESKASTLYNQKPSIEADES